MVDTETAQEHRSGYVTLLGRPNVGKSTLLNAFLGQIIAPVSFRPQTTRIRQLGILSLHEAQIIFVDTPGLHQPHHKLGERMNAYAREALGDVDLVLVMFDASQPPHEEDKLVAKLVLEKSSNFSSIGVLNKIDLVPPGEIDRRSAEYSSLLPEVVFMPVSATRGDGREELLQKIIEQLPIGPSYFDEDEITDLNEREIASDLIRAAAMQHLREEVPYSTAVRIDDFKERGDTGAYIAATIFVERESQKGIVIGKGGKMLKGIGTSAREEIEAMSGRKVYLELRVKVLPRWRNNPGALTRLGYEPVLQT
jgi:GTP-binding protein Era